MKKEKIKKKLPVGIENFEKIRTENFYYVESASEMGRGESFYQTAKIWKIFKYEYAESIF